MIEYSKKFKYFLIVLVSFLFYYFGQYMIAVDNIGNRDDVSEGAVTFSVAIVLIFGVLCLRKKIDLHDKIFRSLVFFSIYDCIVVWVTNTESTNNMVSHILFIILPILSYCFSKSLFSIYGRDRLFSYLFILILIYFIYEYVNIYIYGNAVRSGGHFAIAYYPMLLLPIFMSFKDKIIKYLAVLVIVAIVLSSGKRTGLIAIVVGMAIYIMVCQYIKDGKVLKSSFISVILIAVGFIVMLQLGSDIDDNESLNRLMSMQSEGGGDREDIYSDLIVLISNSPLEEYLFGHGYFATREALFRSYSAHNDFLETTYDYGMLGLILFFAYFYQNLKKIYSNIKSKNKYIPAYCLWLGFIIPLSMTSHIIIYLLMTLCTFVLGYINGIINYYDKQDENRDSYIS